MLHRNSHLWIYWHILGVFLVLTACQAPANSLSPRVDDTSNPPTPASFATQVYPPSISDYPAPYALYPVPAIENTDYPAPYVPPLGPAAITTPTTIARLTPYPTETVYSPKRPTILPQVVETTPFHPEMPLPFGLSVDIYRMNQSVVAMEVGYPQVNRTLGDRMRWVSENRKAGVARIEKANAVLSSFGYRLEKKAARPLLEEPFSLYRADQLILENIRWFYPVTLNRSKNDFMFNVELENYQWKQVRKDRVIDERSLIRDIPIHDYWPAAMPHFLGDDILTATIEFEGDGGQPWVRVYRNDHRIYQTKSYVMHVKPPLYGLWTYGDHWALEVLEAITIDGQPVNEEYGYQKSFEFTLLGNKPAFFFERDGQVGLNVDGREIQLPGQGIPHYNCCAGATINPRNSDNVISFFLKDGNQWYYVEAEQTE